MAPGRSSLCKLPQNKKHTPEFLKTKLSRGLISFGLFAYATRILTECGKLTKHGPVFIFCFLSSPFCHRCFIWYKSMFSSTQVRNSPDAVMAFNTKFKRNPSKCNKLHWYLKEISANSSDGCLRMAPLPCCM